MPKMKLADWARVNGLSYITAHRHFHAGMIPNAHQLDSGTILVEVESPEQNMAGSSSNDAMSLFLKKTVEFSKNGASVEDFAAYVISNFSLKLASASEGPRYSRQKPKSEDVQKHFKQFIPTGEKPKTNSFVMDPEAFADEPIAKVDISKNVSQEELVKEFEQAVKYGSPVAPRSYAEDVVPGFTPTAVEVNTNTAAMSPTEGTVTRSVDLNTTPQPINYTGSNNPTFSSSSTYAPFTGVETMTGALIAGMGEVTTSFVSSNASLGAAQNNSFGGTVPAAAGQTFYTNSLSPTYGSIELGEDDLTETQVDVKIGANRLGLNQPRKRGRKPSKR